MTTTTIPIENGDGTGVGDYPPMMPAPAAPPLGSTPTPPPPPPPPPPTPPAVPASSGRVSSVIPTTTITVPSVIIPLAATPSQTFAVNLGNQACVISLRTRLTGLYLDLTVSGTVIAQGVICLDRNPIVRAAYTGFAGELLFLDNQGLSDPTYDGLGTRYQLVWFNF